MDVLQYKLFYRVINVCPFVYTANQFQCGVNYQDMELFTTNILKPQTETRPLHNISVNFTVINRTPNVLSTVSFTGEIYSFVRYVVVM